MVTVIGVRFKKAGKIYYFDPDSIDTSNAKHVIVETARGVEFGQLVINQREIPDEDVVAPLKKVLRVATDEDVAVHQENQEKKKKAFEVCQEKIKVHELEMKLIDVEYTFDNNKVIFYFTSDGRVDFRDLVKDLASVFRTRIELRQIGVRDEAKMLNGIGSCGKRLCCANWLGDFEPVSIKMAKDQNLSLNPTKISGICGRLMCCLKYEHETYLDLRKGLPKDNEVVKTPDGKAVVVSTQIIREQVKVRLIVGEEDGKPVLDDDITTYKKQEVKRIRSNPKPNAPKQIDVKPVAQKEETGAKEEAKTNKPKPKKEHHKKHRPRKKPSNKKIEADKEQG
jgi:cell fate regulator YaaT (PSP1 superfamily)